MCPTIECRGKIVTTSSDRSQKSYNTAPNDLCVAVRECDLFQGQITFKIQTCHGITGTYILVVVLKWENHIKGGNSVHHNHKIPILISLVGMRQGKQPSFKLLNILKIITQKLSFLVRETCTVF